MITNDDITFDFNSYGEDYTLILRPDQKYTNGRLCLDFWYEDSECDGMLSPFAKVTVNLPDEHLNPGEVFVKDWAENEPLVQALIAAGWLIPTGREVSSGYVFPLVARLGGPLEGLA